MRRIPVEQRRAELVAAAVRVVTRGGVGALTTRALASEARMPLGSIHYIFASQDDVISAVTEAVRDEQRLAAEVVAERAPTIEEAVRAGLDAYIDLLVGDPARELAVLELALHARRRADPGLMRGQWEGYHATARALLSAAAERADVQWRSPVDDVARLLIAGLDGITLGYLADGDADAARRCAALFAGAVAIHTREAVHDAH